jgi:hypothetical protein
MILLILVVFGAIAAIVWRSWLAGGIVLVVVLLLVGTMYTVRSEPMSATPSTVIIREETARTTSPWEPSEEQKRTADVFTCPLEASSALAKKLCDEIDAKPKNFKISHIHISTQHRELIEPISAVLKERYPKAEIVADENQSTNAAALKIGARLDGSNKTKNLRLTALLDNELNLTEYTRVENKIWVENLQEYKELNRGRNWIVVWSPSPADSAFNAHQQARSAAARKLAEFVGERFPQTVNSPPGGDRDLLRRQLENEIQLGRFKKDEFVQSVQSAALSGRRIYRAAYLLDASSREIQHVQSVIHQQYIHRSHRARSTIFGTLGLGVLICVLYLFLNWATRGYFQMNLRLAASLVLIAAVLLILILSQ